jgi:hypothetical protein
MIDAHDEHKRSLRQTRLSRGAWYGLGVIFGLAGLALGMGWGARWLMRETTIEPRETLADAG